MSQRSGSIRLEFGMLLRLANSMKLKFILSRLINFINVVLSEKNLLTFVYIRTVTERFLSNLAK